ncbi:UPF0382 inner membrane protein YgdD [Rhynchospora pubera]|uniref:UPF0382 inner membrane protein YgdD n=1 Tax=Rhynchospora pubera TaxID=906938 RepID=A0AAV8H9L3_9POAL|nr:UPF0382 inner membrane protein YgdD [Rhynchospora pubera]
MGEPTAVYSSSIEESLINSSNPSNNDKVKTRTRMDPLLWHKVAAIFGIAGLGLGTYGFHMYHPQDTSFKQVWQIANLYHLTHTAALVGAPLTRRPHIFGVLLAIGILLFSGGCYTAAYFENKKYSLSAPFGGFAFVAGWASLLF